jgi:hypothetical protein
MNHLVAWFLEQTGAQLLAIHQPGKRNRVADALSRDGNGGDTIEEVLDEARAAGMRIRRLQLPEGIWAVLQTAAERRQRSTRSD